ncbi:prolyl oligopeptidase family serine peptidase [Peribacillus kribbensis]|uniref:prolyl oligopeptidase family serine peptidase n=1 Tax=Peribacillus kribbensis TaxID=356658 RepID=UPI00316AC0A3
MKKERIGDIHLLHIAKQDSWNESLPFIIFIHGITSAKEHNLHYAYLLAEKGFRVVLPDTYLHGERDTGLPQNKVVMAFWDIVIKTIKELQEIKEHYVITGQADPGRIGMAGTSMGGIITYGALAQYSWIKAAVSLMGNPGYVHAARSQVQWLKDQGTELPFSEGDLDRLFTALAEHDLTMKEDKLDGRPLMIWHGQKDTVVPYEPAREFYNHMKLKYNDPEQLLYILDTKAGHKVSREGLLKTAEWFGRYL